MGLEYLGFPLLVRKKRGEEMHGVQIKRAVCDVIHPPPELCPDNKDILSAFSSW